MNMKRKARQKVRAYRNNLAQSHWMSAIKIQLTLSKVGKGVQVVAELLPSHRHDHPTIVNIFRGSAAKAQKKFEHWQGVAAACGLIILVEVQK
jgi:hypothetical protein